MNCLRPLTQWPEERVGPKKLHSASQVQYFFKEEQEGGNTVVNTYATNILAKNKPYSWYNVPASIIGIIRVMLWIQWTYGHLYLVRKHQSKLLESYVIYMETIIDGLWDAIEKGRLDEWLKEVATPWVVIQRTTGFHSEKALEMAIGNGTVRTEDFAEGIVDWDSQADILLDIRFPGSKSFDEEYEQRLDRRSVHELQKIMDQVVERLNREEGGESYDICLCESK